MGQELKPLCGMSVFIQLAAFLSSDTPQQHHRVGRLVLGWGCLEALLCFVLPAASGEDAFFFC